MKEIKEWREEIGFIPPAAQPLWLWEDDDLKLFVAIMAEPDRLVFYEVTLAAIDIHQHSHVGDIDLLIAQEMWTDFRLLFLWYLRQIIPVLAKPRSRRFPPALPLRVQELERWRYCSSSRPLDDLTKVEAIRI